MLVVEENERLLLLLLLLLGSELLSTGGDRKADPASAKGKNPLMLGETGRLRQQKHVLASNDIDEFR